VNQVDLPAGHIANYLGARTSIVFTAGLVRLLVHGLPGPARPFFGSSHAVSIYPF